MTTTKEEGVEEGMRKLDALEETDAHVLEKNTTAIPSFVAPGQIRSWIDGRAWDDLGNKFQASARALGYDMNSWKRSGALAEDERQWDTLAHSPPVIESPGIKNLSDAAKMLGFTKASWDDGTTRSSMGQKDMKEDEDEEDTLLGSDVEDYKAEVKSESVKVEHGDLSDLARKEGALSPEPEYDDKDIQELDPFMFNVRAPT